MRKFYEKLREWINRMVGNPGFEPGQQDNLFFLFKNPYGRRGHNVWE